MEKNDEKVIVKVFPDGPYEVKGNFSFIGKDGKEIPNKGTVHLCCCGASKNKPYCDGSHHKVNFKDGVE